MEHLPLLFCSLLLSGPELLFYPLISSSLLSSSFTMNKAKISRQLQSQIDDDPNQNNTTTKLLTTDPMSMVKTSYSSGMLQTNKERVLLGELKVPIPSRGRGGWQEPIHIFRGACIKGFRLFLVYAYFGFS